MEFGGLIKKKYNKIKINQFKNLKGDWFNFLSVAAREDQSDFIAASTAIGATSVLVKLFTGLQRLPVFATHQASFSSMDC